MDSEKASSAWLGAAGLSALQLARRIELEGRVVRALSAGRILVAPLIARGMEMYGRSIAWPTNRIWLKGTRQAASPENDSPKQRPAGTGSSAALAELSRLSQLGRTLALLVQRALLLPGFEPRNRASSPVSSAAAGAEALNAAAAKRAIPDPAGPTHILGSRIGLAPALEVLVRPARLELEGLVRLAGDVTLAGPPRSERDALSQSAGTPAVAFQQMPFRAAGESAHLRETGTALDGPTAQSKSWIAPRDSRGRFSSGLHDVRAARSRPTEVASGATIDRGSTERTGPARCEVPERHESTVQHEDPGQDLQNRFSLPKKLREGGFGWLERAAQPARLHTDGHADRQARSFRADAVTLGRDIYFRHGKFEPGSPRGMALIAHELVHVAQQEASVLGDPLLSQRLETDAVHMERHVYRLLAEPVTVSAVSRGSRHAHAAPPTERIVPHGRPAASAPPGNAAGATAAVVPLPAAEDRAAPAAADSVPDEHEIAARVYRLLDRKLRIDRERLGLGRL